jgi:biopolymer transport protein ExbD
MKLAKGGQANFESKMDMTPLIDCIFQLILFLVLTSQINVQTEEVELPYALEGKNMDEVKEPVPPVIVNIIRVPGGKASAKGERPGAIRMGGKDFVNDRAKLAAELKREVLFDASPQGRNRGYEPALLGGLPLSKLSVLVRADRGVRAEYVRTVLMACTDVGIYRVRVSSTTPQQ